MKNLSIICEGHTENEFVDFILNPFFKERGIDVFAFKITKSDGGLSNYFHYRNDVLKVVHNENTIVTSLIDFYALPPNFPKYAQSLGIDNISEHIDFLERSIIEDINNNQGRHFDNLVPYIQQHEFEALLFTNMIGFNALFDAWQADFHALQDIITQYPNPEDINDSALTAPSKRLLDHIPRYNKKIDGNLIIDEIGLDDIRSSCPRFNNWIDLLLVKIAE